MTSWHAGDSARIASGAEDARIAERADAVRAFGRPLFVRYGWEMDARANRGWAGSPEDFVAAWRRIRGIFERRGPPLTR